MTWSLWLPEPANWMVAIPVLMVTVIQLVWALDLISTSITPRGQRCKTFLDGAFWLGIFLCSLAVFLSGAVGVLLLGNPHGTTPVWFAPGMVIASAAGIAAWYLLTFTYQEDVDDDA